MRRVSTTTLSVLAALALAAAPALRADDDDPNEKGSPQAHVHPVRGAKPVKGGGSPDMIFHGGTVLTTSATQAIFWGINWSDTSFAADKITGLDAFYAGFGGSNYAKASTEYTGSNGQVGSGSAYQGHLFDATAAPSHAPKTSTIIAEVCKMVTNPDPSGLGYYAVYTDLPRGHAGYCAWHSWGSCNGVPVQVAFFFSLDGDPGCDPQDGTTGHSQGLAALANVSAHELSEAMTDPRGAGWFDSSGAENGDKCAWTFNVDSVSFPGSSSQWKLQGEWSNAAFDAGTGYPNRSGQLGCLDGH